MVVPTNFSITNRHVVLVAIVSALFLLFLRTSPNREPLVPAVERISVAHFEFQDLDGRNWRVDQQKEQPTIVNFWATWCGPCREEIPMLEGLHKKGFRVVGVSLDDDPKEAVGGFVDERPIGYPVLMPTARGFHLPGGISGIPTTILVDSQGKMAKRYIGLATERELENDYSQLVREK
jgi:cytochrome c biogenesis protein CcmG, thiol:disulfide interchange protein DsbE